ncbi:YfiR family protein [Desulfogranum japonicum]|uniref:YfiR family protein n=1 Tax=Desulfogranum japonicum TaxID=231447 RepID=UPI000403F51B|nr:YfiR family protein [Desulfogranum japonicum]
MRRLLLFSSFLVMLLHTSVSLNVHGATEEEHVKAVFLYNLIHFVSWPQETMNNRNTFTIGVLGDVYFSEIVEEAVKGEKKGGLPIQMVYFEDVESALRMQPHLLFISENYVLQWFTSNPGVNSLPILTVGDSKQFCQQGGMVNLLNIHNRIQIEINPDAVEPAGISISSKLLSLAKLVK